MHKYIIIYIYIYMYVFIYLSIYVYIYIYIYPNEYAFNIPLSRSMYMSMNFIDYTWF